MRGLGGECIWNVVGTDCVIHILIMLVRTGKVFAFLATEYNFLLVIMAQILRNSIAFE
jgi:hypothetical protein